MKELASGIGQSPIQTLMGRITRSGIASVATRLRRYNILGPNASLCLTPKA